MAVCYVRAAIVLLAAAMCVFLASASPRVLHQAKPAAKPVAKAAAALALPSSNALCVGPTAPAKFRYVWAYEMKDPTPANVKAMDALVKQWMKMCEPVSGGSVVRYGQGGALTKDPKAFGYKAAPPPTATLADYGAWSDWRSLDDLAKCYKAAITSGITPKIRVYAKSAARLVLPMSVIKGNARAKCASAGSLAPATTRYMVMYMLADDTPAGQAKADAVFDKISALSPLWVRSAIGADQAPDQGIFGSGVMRTANYGLFRDYLDFAQLKTDLNDAAAAPFVAQLRGLAKKSMRVAIPLSATYGA